MSKRTKAMHALCAFMLAGSMLFGGLCCTASYIRFGLACKSIGLSVGYFFVKLFGYVPTFAVDIIKLPDNLDVSVLPSTTADFGERWERFCIAFVTPRNAKLYLSDVGDLLFYLLIAIAVVICLWLIFKAVLTHTGKKVTVNKLTESKPLKAYKRFRDTAIKPTVRFVRDLWQFLKDHKAYHIPIIVIWTFNLNLPTIVFNAVAFAAYFAVTFDAAAIYPNIVRLTYDLKPTFTALPPWLYVIVGLWLYDLMAKRNAVMYLRSMEWSNRAFLDELPVAVMLVGTMGKGKTMLLTDMSLSRQAMFRDKAREGLKELQMCFTDFPWLRFELELKDAVENRSVYNLVMCRRYIRAKRKAWETHAGNSAELWFYDGPIYFDNALYNRDIWEILEVYAQLYYIYTVSSSVIVGNYSVRDDATLMDQGNFPEWDSDFVSRTADDVENSEYSHIIDFDAMRPCKTVEKNNPRAGSFEFGVIGITEIGKERGNQNDTKGVVKVTDETANRLNDGFKRWLKLCRHLSTVEYFPYVSVYMDDQRPESLAADAKELCLLLHVGSKVETGNALPWYGIRTWIYDKLYGVLSERYMAHRFMRSDDTLFSHLIHAAASILYKHKKRMDNLYGYSVAELGMENGTQDGAVRKQAYYIVNKKIYAKRYDTACFADIFARAAARTDGGVDAYPTYENVRASLTELRAQNSYFVNEIAPTLKRDKAECVRKKTRTVKEKQPEVESIL